MPQITYTESRQIHDSVHRVYLYVYMYLRFRYFYLCTSKTESNIKATANNPVIMQEIINEKTLAGGAKTRRLIFSLVCRTDFDARHYSRNEFSYLILRACTLIAANLKLHIGIYNIMNMYNTAVHFLFLRFVFPRATGLVFFETDYLAIVF